MKSIKGGEDWRTGSGRDASLALHAALTVPSLCSFSFSFFFQFPQCLRAPLSMFITPPKQCGWHCQRERPPPPLSATPP